MKYLIIVFFAIALQAQQGMMCSAPGVKKPSLTMLDSKGKCQKGSVAMKDKDGKAMFCVNTEHPKPVECKPIKPAAPKATK